MKNSDSFEKTAVIWEIIVIFYLKNLKEKKRLYYDGRGGEWMIWMELGMANVSRWI